MKSIKKALFVSLFLIVGIILFVPLSKVFLEKTSYPVYRNYKRQDNVDILVLGSSHSINGIDASSMSSQLCEFYGHDVDVFNYSIFGMRIEHIRFFFNEALKSQKPDIVIIDTYSFLPIADEHREILARRAFDEIPLSKNKIDAINYLIPREWDRMSYYVPFMEYHNRWKELSKEDFLYVFSNSSTEDKGLYGSDSETRLSDEEGFIDDRYFDFDLSLVDEEKRIEKTQDESLTDIIETARLNDIKLIFITTPYKDQIDMNSIENRKVNNYLQSEYFDGESIPLLDLNLFWKDLNFGYGDLMDEGHVNKYGAKKTTDYVTNYIKENYDL